MEVEYNYITGHPSNVYDTLTRKIRAYKGFHEYVKVGITGRDPQIRFNEHLRDRDWDRMVVIYETTSARNANIIEEWLVEEHFVDLVNERPGGGSVLSEDGLNYVYVLISD